MTDQPNNQDSTSTGDGTGAARPDRSLIDLVSTPFYAWIGAGARTAEMLNEIGGRVREEERARNERTRERAKEIGGQVGDQSRETFLRAVDAAQEAFNAALRRAQAGGDRAFGASRDLPGTVERGLGQLQPDQLRTLADGYLEAASQLYAELAARGERVVDDVRAGRVPGAGDGDVIDGEVVDGDGGPAPLFPGADRVGEVADRLREAGEDLRRRAAEDAEAGRAAVQGNVQALLRQAADVTEALLGALRGVRPAPSADDLSAEAADAAAAAAEEAAERPDGGSATRPAEAPGDAVESGEDGRPADGGAS